MRDRVLIGAIWIGATAVCLGFWVVLAYVVARLA
jgi:hypothetical protein